MLSLLHSLQRLLKIKTLHDDFALFRLHHQLTVVLLLAFCSIASTKQIFADPLTCRAPSIGYVSYMEDYCWATGTYTSKHNSTKAVGAPYDSNQYEWHLYYRFIHLTLFFQAVLFYLPRYIWILLERGVVTSICRQLHASCASQSVYEDVSATIKLNDKLVYKYHACQLLSLLNLIAQIMWMHWLFNDHYLTYGIDAIKYYWFTKLELIHQQRIKSPLDTVFPKETGCTIEYPSAVGDTNIGHAQCILSFQILNDKMFLFLWFWLAFLSLATVLHQIYAICWLALPIMRRWVLARELGVAQTELRRALYTRNTLFIVELLRLNLNTDKMNKLLQHLHHFSETDAIRSTNGETV